MSQIPSRGVDRKNFEGNAHHVGAQRDAVGRKDIKSASSAEEAADIAERSANDQVDLAERGQEAGAHTGISGNLASQARRLQQTRQAMESGEVHAGDVDPGQAQAANAEAPAEAPRQEGPSAVDPLKSEGPVDPSQAAQHAGPTGETPPPPGGSTRTDYANRSKQAQDDAQQSNMIFQQMAADRQKWMMEIWKIWQDTQTKIFEIMQSVMLNRQRVMDAMADKWAATLGGYA